MSNAPKIEQTVRIAGVVRESIVDGPGIRFTVFTQGCPHRCPQCHNPQTHDPAEGYDCAIARLLEEIDRNPLLQGITLSGGEPFEQAEALLPLAQAVCERGRDVVIFSGYTFEQLLAKAESRPAIKELLSLCRLLIDGRFVVEEKDLTLRFRGSHNQRLIDPVASLATGIVVLSNL